MGSRKGQEERRRNRGADPKTMSQRKVVILSIINLSNSFIHVRLHSAIIQILSVSLKIYILNTWSQGVLGGELRGGA